MKIERLIAMVLVIVILIPKVGVRAESVKCEECGKSIYIKEEDKTAGEIIMGIYKTSREKEDEPQEEEKPEGLAQEEGFEDNREEEQELTKGEMLGVVLVIIMLVVFIGYIENYTQEQEPKEPIEDNTGVIEQDVGWLK